MEIEFLWKKKWKWKLWDKTSIIRGENRIFGTPWEGPRRAAGSWVVSLGILSDVSFSHCSWFDFLRLRTLLDFKILWKNNGNRNPVRKKWRRGLWVKTSVCRGENADFWDPLGRPSESRLVWVQFLGDFESRVLFSRVSDHFRIWMWKRPLQKRKT